ncbi:MAG: hypothetical protein WCO63_12575 [Bacteroidota bacterium]
MIFKQVPDRRILHFLPDWSDAIGSNVLEITVNQPAYAGTTPPVSSLWANGTNIKWYSAASGGVLISGTELLVNGQVYYASQTVNGCESPSRFKVTAVVDLTPSSPTGSQTQNVATIADLIVTGSMIRWYDVSSGGTTLPGSTVLESGHHYYATQTLNCLESASRLDVRKIP